ncbi:hypothetical protein ES705_20372 [subsurface metagenome]
MDGVENVQPAQSLKRFFWPEPRKSAFLRKAAPESRGHHRQLRSPGTSSAALESRGIIGSSSAPGNHRQLRRPGNHRQLRRPGHHRQLRRPGGIIGSSSSSAVLSENRKGCVTVGTSRVCLVKKKSLFLGWNRIRAKNRILDRFCQVRYTRNAESGMDRESSAAPQSRESSAAPAVRRLCPW